LDIESELELEPAPHGRLLGGAVIAGTALLYAVFF